MSKIPAELQLSEELPNDVPKALVPLKNQALEASDPLTKQKFQLSVEQRGKNHVIAIARFSQRIETIDVNTTTNSSNKQIARVEKLLQETIAPSWWDKLWDRFTGSTAAKLSTLNKSIPTLHELKDQCIRQEALLIAEQTSIRQNLLDLKEEITAFKALHRDLDALGTDQAFDVLQHQQHLMTSYTVGLQGYAMVAMMLDGIRTVILSIDRIYTQTLTALRVSHQVAGTLTKS